MCACVCVCVWPDEQSHSYGRYVRPLMEKTLATRTDVVWAHGRITNLKGLDFAQASAAAKSTPSPDMIVIESDADGDDSADGLLALALADGSDVEGEGMEVFACTWCE